MSIFSSLYTGNKRTLPFVTLIISLTIALVTLSVAVTLNKKIDAIPNDAEHEAEIVQQKKTQKNLYITASVFGAFAFVLVVLNIYRIYAGKQRVNSYGTRSHSNSFYGSENIYEGDRFDDKVIEDKRNSIKAENGAPERKSWFQRRFSKKDNASSKPPLPTRKPWLQSKFSAKPSIPQRSNVGPLKNMLHSARDKQHKHAADEHADNISDIASRHRYGLEDIDGLYTQ